MHISFCIVTILFALPSEAQTVTRQYKLSEDAAREMVKSAIAAAPVIDGHNDLFVHFMGCKDCPRGVQDYRLDTINSGQTNIPRLREGGVGALLVNVYGEDSGRLSYSHAWDLLGQLEQEYHKDLQIVRNSRELESAMKDGKIALLVSLEGAIRLNNDTALLRKYYEKGLRSVTFAYKTNDLADGSDDTVRHHGISDVGRLMVKQMNDLGVLIDMSHISSEAMHAILKTTRSPVIFSHSNARSLCDINRNVSDDILLELKLNRGLIMLTLVPYFVKKEHMLWLEEGDSLYEKAQKDYPGKQKQVDSIMMVWEKENPEPYVGIEDLADHFDYVKNLIGVDFIGIAGDFDGISFTIRGLEDVSTFPALLTELARRGWTFSDLQKISSGNFLRVFREVESLSFAK
jgi:membrane dipeptidase